MNFRASFYAVEPQPAVANSRAFPRAHTAGADRWFRADQHHRHERCAPDRGRRTGRGIARLRPPAGTGKRTPGPGRASDVGRLRLPRSHCHQRPRHDLIGAHQLQQAHQCVADDGGRAQSFGTRRYAGRGRHPRIRLSQIDRAGRGFDASASLGARHRERRSLSTDHRSRDGADSRCVGGDRPSRRRYPDQGFAAPDASRCLVLRATRQRRVAPPSEHLGP